MLINRLSLFGPSPRHEADG